MSTVYIVFGLLTAFRVLGNAVSSCSRSYTRDSQSFGTLYALCLGAFVTLLFESAKQSAREQGPPAKAASVDKADVIVEYLQVLLLFLSVFGTERVFYLIGLSSPI